jgi:three-Cys-motif partner protein
MASPGAAATSAGHRSPLIFIEELKRATEAVNTHRAAQGLNAIEVECLLVFNDASRDAIELLKTHGAAPGRHRRDLPEAPSARRVSQRVFRNRLSQDQAFPEQGRYRSVIFNLDQCGHSHVERNTILDIMHSYPAAEIFLHLRYQFLLAFLQKDQLERLRAQLDHLVSPAAMFRHWTG